MTKRMNGIEFAQEIEKVKQQLPLQLQAISIQAKTLHSYYKALQKEGFTSEQALEIIKSRGLS